MGFSRQKYWNGLLCLPQGNLPHPGMEPGLPHCRWILHCLEHWSGQPIPPPEELPDPGLNRGLLHFRQILYQLSYQGSKNTGTKTLQSCLILVTPWTVVCRIPLSMGFFRQEYWSGLPFPSPGDLPDPGIEPASPVPPALAGRFFTSEPPGKLQSPFSTSSSPYPHSK